MKKVICFLVVFLILTCFSSPMVQGQKWQEIVPLISNCDEVKKLFAVPDCKLPDIDLEYPSYSITIDFKRDTDGWNVSKDTVVGIVVIFNDVLRLRDYETDFSNYTIKPESDTPEVTIYTNDIKGVRLSVQSTNGVPYIWSLFIYPSKENAKKFKCKPKPVRSSRELIPKQRISFQL